MIKAFFKRIISERFRNKIYFTGYKIRGLFYRGSNFYCICCNQTYRHFLSYGNTPRKNALCPSCHALERTRILMYYLEREVKIFNNKPINLLHFAPEKSIEKRLKKFTHIHYISADINSNLADHVVDITDIPFEDNSFDLIICSHVLRHVPNEEKAIDELYRVLKPKGEAIIMTVIYWNRENTYENESIISPEKKLKKIWGT